MLNYRAKHFIFAVVALISASASYAASYEVSPTGQLSIGETFFIRSPTMNEDRRINVYFPPGFAPSPDAKKMPVMFMPDGGMGEDFLHIAGLIQVTTANGTGRPFLLVGIENIDRRRDLTMPTENADEKADSPTAGGSQQFRNFIRHELMPEIAKRYPITDETAIIGESLAGLFVVETFLLEPDLFDIYFAIDPSLWWNNQWLTAFSEASIEQQDRSGKSIFIATSGEPGMAEPAARLDAALAACKKKCARHYLRQMPQEMHATIFHPAALEGFRSKLGSSADPTKPVN